MSADRTSLYRHFDKDGRLLYVGVSLHVIRRLAQHRDSSHWYAEIASVNVEWFESRELALKAERAAVAKEKPLHNRMLQREDQPEPEPERAVAAIERPLLRLNPLYRLNEAAALLCISTSRLRTLLDAGQIGFVEINPPRALRGRISRYYGITGWQIVEYLEHLENRSRKVA